jgi:hypothetical protein
MTDIERIGDFRAADVVPSGELLAIWECGDVFRIGWISASDGVGQSDHGLRFEESDLPTLLGMLTDLDHAIRAALAEDVEDPNARIRASLEVITHHYEEQCQRLNLARRTGAGLISISEIEKITEYQRGQIDALQGILSDAG